MATKHRNGHADFSHDVDQIKTAFLNTAANLSCKASDVLTDSVDGVKETSDAVKNNLAKYTAKKPLKSLSIALLVGVTIGYLLRK